jgi:Mn2+/Fe2+ NRAMP family transporter
MLIRNPVRILVTAGALNGLVLPLSLGVILLMANRLNRSRKYKHPLWLIITGWMVVALMTWMSVMVIKNFMIN